MAQDRFDIFVVVPKNRNLCGRLVVEKNGRSLRTMQVLARGSQGPGATQFQNNGNTPVGTYNGSVFQQPLPWRKDAYGKYGEIRLKPLSGDALIAEQVHGRSGLLIHAGSLSGAGYWRGEGVLRATNGCLRISNSDMYWLKSNVFGSPPTNACVLSPRVTVTC